MTRLQKISGNDEEKRAACACLAATSKICYLKTYVTRCGARQMSTMWRPSTSVRSKPA